MRSIIGYILLICFITLLVTFFIWRMYGDALRLTLDEIVSTVVMGLLGSAALLSLFRVAISLFSKE